MGSWAFLQMLEEYAGRGIPTLMDQDIARMAMDRHADFDTGAAVPVGGAPMNLGDMRDGGSASGGSGASSSAGSSASTAQMDKLVTLVTERLDAVTASQTKMAADLQRVQSRYESLSDRIQKSLSNAGGGPTEMRCFKCGSTEHTVKDCPLNKKKPEEPPANQS